MFKRNSSLPNFAVKRTENRQSSAPEILFRTTDQENIEIRWTEIDIQMARQKCCELESREATASGSAAGKKSPETKHEQDTSEHDGGDDQQAEENDELKDANKIQGITGSSSEDSIEDICATSEGGIKHKGMTKRHYVDKTLKKACSGCQKQFKLKRKPKHCRRCGDVFCVKCLKFRRKLNIMAHPDPEGKLRKVCRICFEEDPLCLGCTRNLTEEFSRDRLFAKHARIISNRVNSLTNTFWPDQIDHRDECVRLINGFQREMKLLGSLEVLRVKLKTPAWQKSKYWDIEIQATKCRSCKGDVGLRKSRGNCRVCGLALCTKCSHKELLLFLDKGDPKIAVLNTVGVPSHEPEISLLLYVCADCKTYISAQQTADVLWYKDNSERNILDDIRDLDVEFERFKEEIKASNAKLEDIFSKADDNDLTTSERRSAFSEITTLRTALNSYDKKLQTVRSWLDKKLIRTERTLLNNYMRCKHDYFLGSRYKCRVFANKLDALENRNKHLAKSKKDFVKKAEKDA